MPVEPTTQIYFGGEPIAPAAPGADRAHGAVVAFTGVVRDHNDGRSVRGILYECHHELAVEETRRLVAEVEAEFPVHFDHVQHRTGELVPGDASLLVVIRSAHRRAAFDAMTSFIDRFKERVPVWKKERYDDDSASWL